MKKILSSISIFAGLVIATAAVPSVSMAQTATNTVSASFQAQLDLLASLTAQVKTLQQQLLAVQQQQQAATAQLVSTLQLGSQGDQVKVLQALLASDSNIYPEGLVTGIFGPATARAVKRFQQQNGLDQVGRVGLKTLGKLREWLNRNPIAFENSSTTIATTSTLPCAIVPPGHLIAPGWLRKNDDEKPIVPPCQMLPPGIEKNHDGNENDNEHENGNGDDHHATSTPVNVSAIGTTVGTSTALISWNTNLPANAQIMYGLTSAYGSSTVVNILFTTSHTQTLTGLTASTTYHFQIKSSAANNPSNTTTSPDMTFTTNGIPAVVVLPTISAISSSAASTTANILWTTNVAANGTVFYATSTPVSITSTSTLSVGTTTLTTSHVLGLTGLTASTTYFYVIQSTDGSSNTTTSTQQSFVTTQ